MNPITFLSDYPRHSIDKSVICENRMPILTNATRFIIVLRRKLQIQYLYISVFRKHLVKEKDSKGSRHKCINWTSVI